MKIINLLKPLASVLGLFIDITLSCIAQLWLWPCTLAIFCYRISMQQQNWQYIRATINPFILLVIITNNWLLASSCLIAMTLPSLAIQHLIMPGLARLYVTFLISPTAAFTVIGLLQGWAWAKSIISMPTFACAFITITIYSYIGRPDDR